MLSLSVPLSFSCSHYQFGPFDSILKSYFSKRISIYVWSCFFLCLFCLFVFVLLFFVCLFCYWSISNWHIELFGLDERVLSYMQWRCQVASAACTTTCKPHVVARWCTTHALSNSPQGGASPKATPSGRKLLCSGQIPSHNLIYSRRTSMQN